MRSHLVLPAALLIACAATPAEAQTRELPVCPSRENAQMLMQSGAGASLPQDCRRVTIRRLDTPSGSVAKITMGRVSSRQETDQAATWNSSATKLA